MTDPNQLRRQHPQQHQQTAQQVPSGQQHPQAYMWSGAATPHVPASYGAPSQGMANAVSMMPPILAYPPGYMSLPLPAVQVTEPLEATFVNPHTGQLYIVTIKPAPASQQRHNVQYVPAVASSASATSSTPSSGSKAGTRPPSGPKAKSSSKSKPPGQGQSADAKAGKERGAATSPSTPRDHLPAKPSSSAAMPRPTAAGGVGTAVFGPQQRASSSATATPTDVVASPQTGVINGSFPHPQQQQQQSNSLSQKLADLVVSVIGGRFIRESLLRTIANRCPAPDDIAVFKEAKEMIENADNSTYRQWLSMFYAGSKAASNGDCPKLLKRNVSQDLVELIRKARKRMRDRKAQQLVRARRIEQEKRLLDQAAVNSRQTLAKVLQEEQKALAEAEKANGAPPPRTGAADARQERSAEMHACSEESDHDSLESDDGTDMMSLSPPHTSDMPMQITA